MSLSKPETILINTYAANELAGALALGKMSRKASDPYLREKLVWHCYEEARHAVIWNDLMKELNIKLLEIHNPKEEKSYWDQAVEQNTIIEFLAFCHIYELRVPFHFQMHLKWTKNPRVQEVLKQLIKEEGPHLSWIRDYLKKEQKNGRREEVLEALKKAISVENKIYERDMNFFSQFTEMHGFNDVVKKKSEEFNRAIKEQYIKFWKFENEH